MLQHFGQLREGTPHKTLPQCDSFRPQIGNVVHLQRGLCEGGYLYDS